MRLRQLDVINDCLATMGETPINSIQQDHPLVATALRLLAEATSRVQAPGWWYNQEEVKLQPDAGTGHIAIPNDYLSLDPSDREQRYTERGRRLYDLDSQSSTFDDPVKVSLIRRVPFEDLPWSAQDMVRAATLIRFVQSYDADEMRIQQVQMDYQNARVACNTEHTRFVQANMLNQGGVGRRRASMRITGARGLPTWRR